MRITVTGRHLDVGASLKEHVQSRLEGSVKKYFSHTIEGDVTLSKNAHLFRADCKIHIGHGIYLQSSDEQTEIYSAFDAAADKLETRLRRYKRRITNHHKERGNAKENLKAQYNVFDVTGDEEVEPEGSMPVIVAEMDMDIPEVVEVRFKNTRKGFYRNVNELRLKRGDIIAVESPTYFAVLRLIEKMGMLALEIDTDPQTGMVLEALEEAFDTMDIKAVLASPNFSNPLGCLMPEENKRALVNMLAERDVPLIEDDVYGSVYFGDKRPRAAKSYDLNNLVLSCSSFSKSLAPGYRIGWVLAGRYKKKVVELKQATFSATSSINQLAMAEFLSSGQYDRHLVRFRMNMHDQVEKGRYMIARSFPEGTCISNPQGGNVVWVEMPRGCNSIDIFNRALQKNIGVTPGILFSATRRFKNYLRINCGFPWNEHNQAAIETLGTIVSESLAESRA